MPAVDAQGRVTSTDAAAAATVANGAAAKEKN